MICGVRKEQMGFAEETTYINFWFSPWAKSRVSSLNASGCEVKGCQYVVESRWGDFFDGMLLSKAWSSALWPPPEVMRFLVNFVRMHALLPFASACEDRSSAAQ
ncbi:hypothetical protein L7F22_046077, partial [Adiantum nelumboides]|nr:hypothetical protein [Adiantum nelumboides]